jgi:hypothetical protein
MKKGRPELIGRGYPRTVIPKATIYRIWYEYITLNVMGWPYHWPYITGPWIHTRRISKIAAKLDVAASTVAYVLAVYRPGDGKPKKEP